MAKPLPPIANPPTADARRLVERIVEHVRLLPPGDAREPGAVDRLAVAVDLFVAERLAAANAPPPPAGLCNPIARVVVEVELRRFDDSFRPHPLPEDVSDEAIEHTARRLAVYEPGALLTTTLFREPGNMDSDSIENVGGGLRVVGVAVRR